MLLDSSHPSLSLGRLWLMDRQSYHSDPNDPILNSTAFANLVQIIAKDLGWGIVEQKGKQFIISRPGRTPFSLVDSWIESFLVRDSTSSPKASESCEWATFLYNSSTRMFEYHGVALLEDLCFEDWIDVVEPGISG